jgi:hypothetical protein
MPNPPARISPLLRAVVRRVLHPDFFSSVYVWRALAPGPASPLLRRARAHLGSALGGRSGLTGHRRPT